jgi:hypothetical protein
VTRSAAGGCTLAVTDSWCTLAVTGRCSLGDHVWRTFGRPLTRGPHVATRHRAFRRLDHAACARVLGQWFAAHRQGLAPAEALALDSKTLRGMHGEQILGVHVVAASAQQTRVVLAQAETVGKGHELAGVQAMLAALPVRLLAGQVVTGAALVATRAVCRSIVRKGALVRRAEGEPAADVGGRRAQLRRSVDAARAGGGRGDAAGRP